MYHNCSKFRGGEIFAVFVGEDCKYWYYTHEILNTPYILSQVITKEQNSMESPTAIRV